MQEKIVSDRHKIEAEFSRNAEELERARREKEDALAQQRAVEAQIKTLAAEKSTGAEAEKLASDIAALEAEAREARDNAEAAEEAQRKAQAAADANREFMELHRHEESESRGRFEEEIAGWLQEQEAYETSELQQQILANQKAHLERIKERAQAARRAAKRHDKS